MNDLLSIRAAALEAADTVALRIGDEQYSFADLARLVGSRLADLTKSGGAPYPLVGTNTLDTLLTLYALLELHRPAMMLHPRLTAGERNGKVESTARLAPTMPADAAAILYTSGTTGRARGAVLTRAALIASAQASSANLGWQDDDCWLLAMPLARVGGLSIITRCLAARRAVALVPSFDAAQLPRWLGQHRVTLLSLVPTMLAQLLVAHPDWRPPPHLRAVLIGGAAASPTLLARAAERGVPIIITYGCTETCSQIVATPYERRFEAATCGSGKVLPTAQLRIDLGRILVRGPMCMSGYLGESPLEPNAWFDTGDLGEVDAKGFLQLHARRADLIVSGGENVYPAEVERVLESCPGIRAAAVFGLADETWGQVVAAALVTETQPPADEVLLDHLTARLAPHKRPRRIGVVPSLPLTPAGKLDRAALATLRPTLRPLGRHGQ
jgi:O-succinylbenzoic acid--CoA ligase